MNARLLTILTGMLLVHVAVIQESAQAIQQDANLFGLSANREPTINEIIAGMKSDDPSEREAAVWDVFDSALSEAELKKAVPVLETLLSDDVDIIRIEAANRLSELDYPKDLLLPVLIDGLNSSHDKTRSEAIYRLHEFGRAAEPVYKKVIPSLDDKDPYVRSLSALVLGNMGPDHKEKLAPVLIEQLDDENLLVRIRTAEALAAIDGPIDRVLKTLAAAILEGSRFAPKGFSGGSNIYSIMAAEKLGIDAVELIPALIKAMETRNVAIQIAASEALATMGPHAKDAIDSLAVALRDGECHGMPFVHRSWCASDDAAVALAAIGKDAVPALIAAVDDPNERVRANVAKALGQIPEAHGKSIPVLVKLLDDEEVSVRAISAWSLGLVAKDSQSEFPQLVAMLFEDTDWLSAPAGGGIAQRFSVPEHALNAIKLIKPHSMTFVPSLQKALAKKQSISVTVAKEIAALGADGLPLKEQLVELLNEEDYRVPAAYAIAGIDPDHAGLQELFEQSLIKEKNEIDLLATVGLGLLGKRATTSLPKLRAAIPTGKDARHLPGSHYRLHLALAALTIDINNEDFANDLLETLPTPGGRYGTYEKLESQLIRIVRGQKFFRNKLIEQLAARDLNPYAYTEQEEIDQYNRKLRMQAAAILSSAGIEKEKSLKVLIEAFNAQTHHKRAKVIEVIERHGPRAAIAADSFVEHLDGSEIYYSGGNAYGIGGESRSISEAVVRLLASIGKESVTPMRAKLSDEYHIVRANAAKALGLIGADAKPAIEDLILLTKDASHLVRREAVAAIGSIAGSFGDKEDSKHHQISDSLKLASQDDRISVRRAAIDAIESASRMSHNEGSTPNLIQ